MCCYVLLLFGESRESMKECYEVYVRLPGRSMVTGPIGQTDRSDNLVVQRRRRHTRQARQRMLLGAAGHGGGDGEHYFLNMFEHF